MNISTEHISQCNQSESIADASGKMVNLMNEKARAGLSRYNSRRAIVGILLVSYSVSFEIFMKN